MWYRCSMNFLHQEPKQFLHKSMNLPLVGLIKDFHAYAILISFLNFVLYNSKAPFWCSLAVICVSSLSVNPCEVVKDFIYSSLLHFKKVLAQTHFSGDQCMKDSILKLIPIDQWLSHSPVFFLHSLTLVANLSFFFPNMKKRQQAIQCVFARSFLELSDFVLSVDDVDTHIYQPIGVLWAGLSMK